jgi:hypothetical protein
MKYNYILVVVFAVVCTGRNMWPSPVDIYVHGGNTTNIDISGAPRIFFWGGVSTNSFEDKGQRERGSGGGNPLFRSSTQFENE